MEILLRESNQGNVQALDVVVCWSVIKGGSLQGNLTTIVLHIDRTSNFRKMPSQSALAMGHEPEDEKRDMCTLPCSAGSVYIH
jgi:hypothetical protein